ncbi:MAG TPA: hypothetical protein VIV65_10340 [Gemmatimonadaceae bacterium]
MRASRRQRSATTLAEMCLVLAIFAALMAIAIPRVRAAVDRAAARGAIRDAGSQFAFARRAALTRRALVAVAIDTGRGLIVVRCGTSTLAARGIASAYGVRLSSTRDSMSYDPGGLGYGAANLSLIARRGAAAETLLVSRLGRVRH